MKCKQCGCEIIKIGNSWNHKGEFIQPVHQPKPDFYDAESKESPMNLFDEWRKRLINEYDGDGIHYTTQDFKILCDLIEKRLPDKELKDSENKTCDCKKWIENIDFVNKPFLSKISAIGPYKGVCFKYCPWCAKDLTPV